jgi:hypothetical protein
MDVFYTTPRLHVLSAEKRCGKTTLLNVTKLLVREPIAIVNPSPASLYTLIEQIHPTLLLDEIDRTFARKDTADITAIVNSGFERGTTVPRVILEPKRKIEYFDVFGPMMLVGIDKSNLPDTIADRSIQIRLKRRVGSELVEAYRPRTKAAEGLALQERLQQWAEAVRDKARELDNPIFPPGVEDRNADKWEALFIVADVADVTDVTRDTFVTAKIGGWGARVRQAALDFLREEQDAEPASNSELILKNLSDIFEENQSGADRYKTVTLLDRLTNIDEAPWSSFEYGKPLSGRGLARLLRPYGIKPTTLRFGPTEEAKGYRRADFEDAFKRYLSNRVPTETGVTSVSPVTPVTVNEQYRAFMDRAFTDRQHRPSWR